MVAVAFAVLAWPGNIRDLHVRKGTTVGNLVNPHPEVTAQPVAIVFPEG
jgi:hypothetical protein